MNVSTDTEKLENIKNGIIIFDTSMSELTIDIISYLRQKKDEAESRIDDLIRQFSCNEENRRNKEKLTSDQDQLSTLRAENNREREKEVAILKESKEAIMTFSDLADEINKHLGVLTGVYHEKIDKNASSLKKAINAIEKYNGIMLGTSDTLNGNGQFTGGASKRIDPKALMRSVGKKWANELSKNEKDAIHDYTKEMPPYYKNINCVLRGLEKNFDFGNKERSDSIHSALSKAHTPCDMIVYRGCTTDALGELQNLTNEELVDQVFLDKGFVSTSMTAHTAFFSDILLIILLPQGSNAANIETLSAAGQYEEEVLIDRNHFFHITSAYENENGRRVIEATMD